MELKQTKLNIPNWPRILLIVPYGIETVKFRWQSKAVFRTFNRTLWN